MKGFNYYCAAFFLMCCFFSQANASGNSIGFATSRDIVNDSVSNIALRNTGNSTVTVYGLYIRQYALVNAGENCDNPQVIYPDNTIPIPPNINVGAFLSPTGIAAHQSAAVGANYLYNLIYQAIYYEQTNIPSSPPGCSLPGCTWGSDSTIYHWCIYLGALAPVAVTADYTSTVPPSGYEASSTGQYDYNLVHTYQYLGPISCNDQTLTCTVSTQQTQSF